MNEGKGMLVEQPSNKEIVFTRVHSAPPELVFKAWIEPKHVVNWWGAKGFTNTIKEMDVRPGGVWRVVMHVQMVLTMIQNRSFSKLKK